MSVNYHADQIAKILTSFQILLNIWMVENLKPQKKDKKILSFL